MAASAIILAGIHAAADTLVRLLLALFFAIVSNPLVTQFIHHGARRSFAIALMVTATLVILTVLLDVPAASLNDFTAILPDFNHALTRKILQFQEYLLFLNLHINPERILRRMDSERPMTWVTTLMTQLSGAMASIVLLVMIVISMLFEAYHLPYKLCSTLNNPRLHITGLHRALKGVTHYLTLKTLISLWTGLVVWLGLLTMGVQFALMWGVLAFLLNYVPSIGSAISTISPMLQALSFSGTYECLLVGALFLMVRMVLGNTVEPCVAGHRLGMSTLMMFLSLLVQGWLLGLVGMLFSAPLTSVCKIWMETTAGGSRLAILLDPGHPKSWLPG